MNSPTLVFPNSYLARRRSTVAAGAALVAAPSLWLPRRALAQPVPNAERRYTPAQTEGPYYPVHLPQDSDFDLLRNGSAVYTKGQAVWLRGTVTDIAGKPVAGAIVEIWQADHAGHYDHPRDGNRADPVFQAFGRTSVGSDGAYRFRTIRPTPYVGRTPHIHFKVKLGSRELLTTQLYVQDDPGNARDFLWRSLGSEAQRALLTVPFTSGADGLEAEFAIVVRV